MEQLLEMLILGNDPVVFFFSHGRLFSGVLTHTHESVAFGKKLSALIAHVIVFPLELGDHCPGGLFLGLHCCH